MMHRPRLSRLKIFGGAAVAAVALVPIHSSGAMPAAAQEGPDNFGQCAAFVARVTPPGPEHGQVMSLASFYNPSGVGFECPGPVPGPIGTP